MCNLVSKWLSVSGTGPVSDIVEDYLKNYVIQEFNPKQADTVLFAAQVCPVAPFPYPFLQEAPEWLALLIQTPKWRQLVYTLSRQYPDCQLLNFTIQVCNTSVTSLSPAAHIRGGISTRNCFSHLCLNIL